MKSSRFQVVGLMLGLMATLLCLSLPVQAAVPEPSQQMAVMSASMDDSMPCCPDDKPMQQMASCAHCPLMPAQLFAFSPVIYDESLAFFAGESLLVGIEPAIDLPPPRLA